MPLVNVNDTNIVQMRELSFVINTLGTDPLHLMCVQDTFRHGAVTEKLSAKTVCKPGREVNGATTASGRRDPNRFAPVPITHPVGSMVPIAVFT